jgi:hypothetical protein
MKARFIFVLAIVSSGCAERVAEPALAAPSAASIAALVVSGSTRQTDGIVTFTARLNAAASPRHAGAYAAHVEYDPNVVDYLGEGDASSGLVAFHAESGVLRVAGTSLDGYADGVLFNARFRVTRASVKTELRLVIDQLRGTDLSDRLPEQLTARTALLRPWR